MQILLFQREAAEGESKNMSEAKKRVAENESSAKMAEATYRAEAHVGVSGFRCFRSLLIAKIWPVITNQAQQM